MTTDEQNKKIVVNIYLTFVFDILEAAIAKPLIVNSTMLN